MHNTHTHNGEGGEGHQYFVQNAFSRDRGEKMYEKDADEELRLWK